MISKYFNVLDSDELRQLRDRYQSLSECKKIEFHKQVQLVQIIYNKLGRIHQIMQKAESIVKRTQRSISRELAFLMVTVLGLIIVLQFLELNQALTTIILMVSVLGLAVCLVYLLDDFANFYDWLNHDKILELERSLLWVEFKQVAFTDYSRLNESSLISVDNKKVNLDSFVDEKDRILIFARVLDHIESI